MTVCYQLGLEETVYGLLVYLHTEIFMESRYRESSWTSCNYGQFPARADHTDQLYSLPNCAILSSIRVGLGSSAEERKPVYLTLRIHQPFTQFISRLLGRFYDQRLPRP